MEPCRNGQARSAPSWKLNTRLTRMRQGTRWTALRSQSRNQIPATLMLLRSEAWADSKAEDREPRIFQPPNERLSLKKVPQPAGNNNIPFFSLICGRILVRFQISTKGSTK